MTKKKSKKDIKAERKMLVSVIEKAVRSEKENSLDDFPALVVANERRIKQLNLTPGVKLSQEGEWRWRGIKEHLGLQKKGNYWLPSRGSNIYKRNQLFEIRENLLARPNNLPILDIAIIVKHYLDHSLKWLEQKIEEDNQSYVQPSSKINLDPTVLNLVREEANKAKHLLSFQDEIEINFPHLPTSSNGIVSYRCSLTRKEFENSCKLINSQLESIIQKFLDVDKVKKNKFTKVVLVGGASRMPVFTNLVKKIRT